jgi:type I restriction enzyme S subunit
MSLMQKLLTGKVRLPGFSEKWQQVKLGDVCDIKTGKKDVNEGNPNGEYPFLLVQNNQLLAINILLILRPY